MRIFILLGSKKICGEQLYCWRVSSGLQGKAYSYLGEVQEFRFYATLRMRIFILLGSKNSVGNSYTAEEQLSCWKVSSRLSGEKAYSCLEKSSEVWVVCQSTGELSEVVVWLGFRLQDNLLGNLEKLDGLHWGLIAENFSSAGDLQFKVLAPLGIGSLKF